MTPAAAIRSTLAKLGNAHTVDDFALAALLCLLDAEPGEIPDASLCLRATASEPDDAYHLVEILQEIDEMVPMVEHGSPSVAAMTKTNSSSAPPGAPQPVAGRASSANPLTVRSASAYAYKSFRGATPSRVKLASLVPQLNARNWAALTNGIEGPSGINEEDGSACMEEAISWREKRHAVSV